MKNLLGYIKMFSCRVLDSRRTYFQPEAKSIMAYHEGFKFTFRSVQFKIYSGV